MGSHKRNGESDQDGSDDHLSLSIHSTRGIAGFGVNVASGLLLDVL